MLISVGVAEKYKVVTGSGLNKTNKNLSKFQMPKILTVLSNVGANVKITWFLISEASKAFILLMHAFMKALILRHFDFECHIKIKTNASGYAIGGVLNQLILNFGQYHPLGHFSRKTILAKT